MQASLVEYTHVMLVEIRVFGKLLVERYLGVLNSLQLRDMVADLLNSLLNGSNLLDLLFLSLYLVSLDDPLLHLFSFHFPFSFLD